MDVSFLDSHLGEVAAVSTAALWVVSSLSFTAAGREVGSSAVNLLRSVLAVAVLCAALWLREGSPLPEFDTRHWLVLGGSGIVGLAIGDQLLFASFVTIGPRVSMLIMTLAPVFALGMAAIAMGERVALLQLAGIAVTLSGVAIVVAARGEHGESHDRREFGFGLLLALGATVCQAGGMVMAKYGMNDSDAAHAPGVLATQSARMIPAAAALIVILGLGRLAGWRLGTRVAPGHRQNRGRAAMCIVLGTAAGPVGGVMCALFAISHLEVGVATTLMALTPVLILPFAVLVEGERLTARSITGAAVAVAGSAILALA